MKCSKGVSLKQEVLLIFFRDIFSLVVVTCNFIYFISLNIFITTLVYYIYIYSSCHTDYPVFGVIIKLNYFQLMKLE